jgi:hypothetical protein
LIERSLAPFDIFRTKLLHAIGPRLCRAIVVPREVRVAWVGAVLGLVALALTAAVPMWLIGLGPLLLGVPHVVSDVRYLLVRPGFHRRLLLMAVIATGMIAAGAGLRLRGGLLAVIGAVLFAQASLPRKLIGVGLAGAALAGVWHAGWIADAIFVQLHNLVAVVWWWTWRPRETKLHWLPLGVFALGSAMILGGALDGMVMSRGADGSPWAGIDVVTMQSSLASFADGPWALRFVLLFAYGQSVHYTIWLRLVPEEDRPAGTPRTFARSYRALLADLGPWLLVVAVAATAVFLGWAFVDVAAARMAYLEVGFFHAYLEVVMLALICVEGRRIGSAAGAGGPSS